MLHRRTARARGAPEADVQPSPHTIAQRTGAGLGLAGRGLLVAAAVLLLAAAPARAADFAAFVAGLWPQAEKAGVSRATFDAAFAGVTPDPKVISLAGAQPEFSQTIRSYVQSPRHRRPGGAGARPRPALEALARPDRAGDGRRPGGDPGDLGAGEQLRQRRRQFGHHPLARHPRLLHDAAPGLFPRRADRGLCRSSRRTTSRRAP